MALLVLSVIVLIHEFGHFLLARIHGVAVVEFSLGFGPRLLSWKNRKSGTRYSLKLIPFGGSCAMLGEFGDEEEAEELKEEFADGRHGESFFKKSSFTKIQIFAAGPIFNFILAFALSVAVVAWAGSDIPEIAQTVEGSAAERAGLQEGDVITKIGNRNVMLTRDIIIYMMVNEYTDMEIEYKRLNEETGKWETHENVLDSEYFFSQNGRILSGMNFYGSRSVTGSLPELLKYSFAETRYNILAVVDSLKMMFRGEVESSDIAGPVRIVSIIDETVEVAAPHGPVVVIMNVLNMIIMFSANLGVLNLVPFPALDGGRIAMEAWVMITKKPMNERVENMINMVSMAILMAFMLFVVFNDLINIF